MLPKDFDKKMRLELMAGNLVKAFKGLFINVIVWEQLDSLLACSSNINYNYVLLVCCMYLEF